jgi:hypothetical protein
MIIPQNILVLSSRSIVSHSWRFAQDRSIALISFSTQRAENCARVKMFPKLCVFTIIRDPTSLVEQSEAVFVVLNEVLYTLRS